MTTLPPPDVHVLYRILVSTARHGSTMFYEEVSDAYERETGVWHHYHGTWDLPLGRINNILHEQPRPLPALSAVVVKKPDLHSNEQPLPGGEFWGCCPSVPARPRSRDRQIELWSGILRDVYEADWPDELPD